jgi:hypothetical protein
MRFEDIIKILENKQGIEFGGPTELFYATQHNMLLYKHVFLDGGNLFEENHFQNKITGEFNYMGKVGKQLNVDCANLESIKAINTKYDFVVTSHVIEHLANPIKAIKSWSDNIIKTNGYILSIIPDYRFCFDRNRPLTSIEHLLSDFNNDTSEDDTTHIEEQKTLHDWAYGGHKDFYRLCEMNGKTRVVHHHTFTPETANQLFIEAGLKPIMTFKHDDLNIINLSIKND